MRRLMVLAGVCGLVAASSIPAFADPRTSKDIKTLGDVSSTQGLFDECNIGTSVPKVGDVHINQRGRSGRGTHLQVMVNSLDLASKTYVLKLIRKNGTQTDIDPGVGVTLVDNCDTILTTNLRVNSQGHGVKNLRAPDSTFDYRVLLLIDDNPDRGTAFFDPSP